LSVNEVRTEQGERRKQETGPPRKVHPKEEETKETSGPKSVYLPRKPRMEKQQEPNAPSQQRREGKNFQVSGKKKRRTRAEGGLETFNHAGRRGSRWGKAGEKNKIHTKKEREKTTLEEITALRLLSRGGTKSTKTERTQKTRKNYGLGRLNPPCMAKAKASGRRGALKGAREFRGRTQ